MIWMAAISLAAAFVLALLSSYREAETQTPQDIASALNVDIVFIGSSLTRHALPANGLTQGILEDGRTSTILSVPAISERHSTKLLAVAIDSGAETVFLEINAYAHVFITLAEPELTGPMVKTLSDIAARMTFIVKSSLNMGRDARHIVLFGARKTDRTLDVEQLQAKHYYRFLKTEPSYSAELQGQLLRARDTNVEVFFFSPPRPASAVSKMGKDEFADLHSHLHHISTLFDVPLWISPVAWPDDHFMDIFAHTNARGRIRFQKELTQWYKEKQ